MSGLGRSTLEFQDRVRSRQDLQRIPRMADFFMSPVVKLVFSILSELGLTWNLQYRFPPPTATKWRREGVIQIPPGETWQFSFKAPERRLVVIDQFDIELVDWIANEYLVVNHYFNDDRNNIDLSMDPGNEIGIWKFDGIILEDGDTYKCTMENTHLYATAVVSIESKGWRL